MGQKNKSDFSYDLIIRADDFRKKYLKDIFKFSDLLRILVWRDFKVRYKQTVIGVFWVLLRPLLIMAVFTLVFNKLGGFSYKNVPYAIVVFSGILPWQFFSVALSEGGNSLINNSNLISKIYFPRSIVPLSVLLVNTVDFLISLLLLFILFIVYNFSISSDLLYIIPFSALMFLFSFACTLIIAALNVKYRDFRYVIPFIVQFGLYVSPVGFSIHQVSEEWKIWISLNPMVGIIEGFRASILGEIHSMYMPALYIALSFTALCLFLGGKYFLHMEREFTDII